MLKLLFFRPKYCNVLFLSTCNVNLWRFTKKNRFDSILITYLYRNRQGRRGPPTLPRPKESGRQRAQRAPHFSSWQISKAGQTLFKVAAALVRLWRSRHWYIRTDILICNFRQRLINELLIGSTSYFWLSHQWSISILLSTFNHLYTVNLFRLIKITQTILLYDCQTKKSDNYPKLNVLILLCIYYRKKRGKTNSFSDLQWLIFFLKLKILDKSA